MLYGCKLAQYAILNDSFSCIGPVYKPYSTATAAVHLALLRNVLIFHCLHVSREQNLDQSKPTSRRFCSDGDA